jgi:hypothetical protein
MVIPPASPRTSAQAAVTADRKNAKQIVTAASGPRLFGVRFCREGTSRPGRLFRSSRSVVLSIDGTTIAAASRGE